MLSFFSQIWSCGTVCIGTFSRSNIDRRLHPHQLPTSVLRSPSAFSLQSYIKYAVELIMSPLFFTLGNTRFYSKYCDTLTPYSTGKKNEQSHFTTCWSVYIKCTRWTNRIDSDQTSYSVTFDLGLYCFLRKVLFHVYLLVFFFYSFNCSKQYI